MISKNDIKKIINTQKIRSRKAIAGLNIKLAKTKSYEQFSIFRSIANEKKFLASEFKDIKDIHDLLEIIHKTKHKSLSKASVPLNCLQCKKVLAEMAIELPGAPAENEATPDKEDELKPRFGNLLAILEQEVREELDNLQRRRMPSQNDLTRWALKNAVLNFYQDFNYPDDMVIVDTLYDDRLTTKLAPDFDIIYKIWMEKLDELTRRDDKYTLIPDEFDKAEADLLNGMRGSAFEKQLDRYRQEFMAKLMR